MAALSPDLLAVCCLIFEGNRKISNLPLIISFDFVISF